MASVEEKVEELYKKICDDLNIRHYGKTEKINDAISNALKEAKSKSGNNGNNLPDIRLLLDNGYNRFVPVMIEAKGTKGKLEKINSKTKEIELITIYEKDGAISKVTGQPTHLAGEENYSAITDYAVNGALHYGNAILNGKNYDEVIIIGVNATTVDKDGVPVDPECKAYYVSEKNNRVPKYIKKITKDDWSLFKKENIDTLYSILDNLNLTEKELEDLTRKTEATLEEKIKSIHQSLYDDARLKSSLSTNEKLYLFCGLIMAGLKVEGMAPLDQGELRGNNNEKSNDGITILNRIEAFLQCKNCSDNKIKMIIGLLDGVFKKRVLWQPNNGKSLLNTLYGQVKNEIIPCLESNLHLDFTGKILNSLNDWVSIENDSANDVVLTPRYVTTLMARLARTNKDSFVWDKAMG